MKWMNTKYIVFALLLLTLVSCKVGKKFSLPTVDYVTSFRGDAISQNEEDSLMLGLINWRTFFKDSSLLQLIDRALQNNFDVRIMLKNIDIANRQLRAANAAFLPTVDLSIASMNKQWRSNEFLSTPSSKWYERVEPGDPPDNWYVLNSQFGSELRFSWEIDIWGKLRSGREEAIAEWLAVQESQRILETNLVASIAKGYFNLMMLDAQRTVAQKNLQLNDSTLRIIKLQFAAGEITALAIQQTESQRLIAASLIPELEQRIAIQENALSLLVGNMPDSIYRSSDIDSVVIAGTGITLGSPLEVVRNRPDIRQSELRLRAANANANVQQAMRYPSLSLDAVFGVNAMLPQNWFNIPGALLGGVTGGLTAPLLQNRRLKTRYEIAVMEREKAEIDFQKSVANAVVEISNTLTIISKQKEQLALTEQRVNTAILAVQNASLLFKSGYATYLEVITAQSNALNSELDLVALKQRQLEAIVDLYRAAGGGWNYIY